MSKHTPWKVSTSHSGAVYVHTGPTWQEGTICKVEHGGLAMGQQIAALPALLAALEAACDIIDLEAAIYSAHAKIEHETANTWSAGDLKAKVNFFRATIAKATGGDL